MSTVPQTLEQVFGVPFTPQATLTELRQYHHPNTYCCNAQGELIGIFSSENEYKNIIIPAEWQTLEYLNLSDNEQLQSLTFEAALPHLQHLDGSDCKLEALTIPAGFDALQWLDTSRNKLQKVQLNGAMPELSYLDLSDNQLTSLTLPAGLEDLAYLYLNDNQLKDLTFSSVLPALQILHLKGNQLENLPANMLALTKLETLYLRGNPLPNIPKEVIADDEQGNSWESVKNYLRELRKGTIINERAKLIIIGNGRVGKTSLYRRLADEPFDQKEPYTHGVQLGKLGKTDLPDVKTDNLQLQVWDFGGQEIFYATHQFFLSEEAVYVLAWTDEQNVKPHRERDKDKLPFDERWRSCDYWLENIRLHGKDSPIVLVQTHTDEIANRKPVNPAWEQTPFNAIPLNFSAPKDYGLPELKDTIANRLNETIPMLGKEFPETYDQVIQSIERIKVKDPAITYGRFLEICETAKIDPGGEKSLLEYLTKAGITVYFDKPLLREVVYINPNWLTQQVYRLINNDLRTRKGKMDTAYLERMLPAPEYDAKQRAQFIELLKSFELIFETQEADQTYYIAPQYLPDQLATTAQEFYESILEDLALALVFRFPKFVPDNVMINFLSRYGPFSKKIYWKNGIYFTNASKAKCIVNFEEATNSLLVFSQDTEPCQALQQEVCQAFVELSKNANAEISLDGKVFASWQELEKYKDLYPQNPALQFFAVDGKTPLKVKDFARFFGKGEAGMTMEKPIIPKKPFIFISYAHKDEHYKDELITHLAALKNQGLIESWHDRQIEAGLWDDQIKAAMEKTDIFLLLITANFLASKYISEIEITKAYQKYKAGTAKIFPIICAYCAWELQPVTEEDYELHPVYKREIKVWLGKFAHFPKDGKPIAGWENKDQAYLNVMESLLKEVLQ